jgi:hypothetical protein
MDYVLILLGAIGLANIFINSSLLDCIRMRSQFMDELLSCPMCSGFHGGWIMCFLWCVHPMITIPFIASWVSSLYVRKNGN